jgi:ubiquinone/menaquinone biosynthesis C-methylase UbiE
MGGKDAGLISDLGFRAMAFLITQIRDRIHHPGRFLERIGIEPGMTVVDYGCGPGSYVRAASRLVGERGHLYAVDIHPLAIESVSRIIEADGLANVTPVLAQGYDSGLGDGVADLVYALDMFHMVGDADAFLKELGRIVRPGGILVIDDGHQPRKATKEKILRSEIWTIEKETDAYLRCRRRR